MPRRSPPCSTSARKPCGPTGRAGRPSPWKRPSGGRAGAGQRYRPARLPRAAGTRAGVVALAGRPDALTQPARFATALAQFVGLSTGRQVAMLESAVRAQPGNLALLMTLGNTYPHTYRGHVAERMRWYQAA